MAERNEICRQVDYVVTSQCPYVLLWNINYVRLLYWNKFGTPPTVLSKYDNEVSAYWYWWYDEDSAEDLIEAMETGEYLPEKKASVFFDEEFTKLEQLRKNVQMKIVNQIKMNRKEKLFSIQCRKLWK